VSGQASKAFGFRVFFNTCSGKALFAMPGSVRRTILALQSGIESAVLRVSPKAVATSGYRCSCENRRCGGVAHSLHLVGAARDYIPAGIVPDTISGLRVIREIDHDHVEIVS